MIKWLFIFMLPLFAIDNDMSYAYAETESNAVGKGFGGNIGMHDNRQYGSLSDPKYRGVAKLTIGNGKCTGVFISPKLVLTNDHCAIKCKNGCSVEFWNGVDYETANLKIVAFYEEYETFNGKDWAILESDKESKFYKQIVPQTTNGPINRGGFGTLRVIKDEEIPFLKKLYTEIIKEFGTKCKNSKDYTTCINQHVEQKLKTIGKQPLLGDSNNFKIQTCNITGTHKKSNKMVQTDCDSAGGDSGAPYLRNGQIVGLNNSGPQNIFNDDESKGSNGLKTENFYEYTQKLIKKYQSSNSFGEVTNSASVQTNYNNITPNTTTHQNQGGIIQPTIPVNQQNINNEDNRIQQMLEHRLEYFDCT